MQLWLVTKEKRINIEADAVGGEMNRPHLARSRLASVKSDSLIAKGKNAVARTLTTRKLANFT